MKADHKAAKEGASNAYHIHDKDCPECNLAAAYLELRELAKAAIHDPSPDNFRALRTALGE